MFCMVHELLPCKERVSRIIPNTSPLCTLCRAQETETYLHCFFTCNINTDAAEALLRCAQAYDSGLTKDRYLRLDIRADDPFTLPTVVMLATGLQLIWLNRKDKKVTTVWAMRAELEARVQLLRRGRTRKLREAGNILDNLLNNFFN